MDFGGTGLDVLTYLSFPLRPVLRRWCREVLEMDVQRLLVCAIGTLVRRRKPRKDVEVRRQKESSV